MMGHQVAHPEQCELINLEEFVPQDHLLRAIDRYLDLTEFREHVPASYSHTGRPSVDPELMIRMLIIGYCYGIRSERRLCEEVHLNLAYRWFCRLGIKDKVPDHSTFSKNRHGRFRDSDAFRQLFESVLRRCMAEGLVRGEGFAVDASVVKADANRTRGVAGTEAIDWNRGDGPSRAVREYLAALDDRNPVEDDASTSAQPATPPKYISLTDPAARWTAAPCGPPFYAYSTNYLIDLHAGIIVDVEATPAYRTQEVDSARTMIDRVEQRFQLKPRRLVGDTAYGTAPMLAWMVEQKKIEPHVPVWDKTERKDDTFPGSDFQWNEQANEYRCPAGHALRSEWRPFKNARTHITKADTVIYRASQSDCAACAMKDQCCPHTPIRKIARSVHEAARNVARGIATTLEYQRSRCERKKVEMLFAHLKRILKLDRLRLRGLSGAQDEFLLAATTQNLRRMAKRLHAGVFPMIPAMT
jgi:transposase